jgi:hypothetical protein
MMVIIATARIIIMSENQNLPRKDYFQYEPVLENKDFTRIGIIFCRLIKFLIVINLTLIFSVRLPKEFVW